MRLKSNIYNNAFHLNHISKLLLFNWDFFIFLPSLKKVYRISYTISRKESKIELKPLNELTRGSYAEKVFIPDPNAKKVFIPDPNVNVIESSAETEGKGLLTKKQQDIHRFKVLKGQILAGNNSKKIVV